MIVTETKVLQSIFKQITASWDFTYPEVTTRESEIESLVKQEGISTEQAAVWVDLQKPVAQPDLLEERYAAILSKYIADEIDREILNSINVKWKTETPPSRPKLKFGV